MSESALSQTGTVQENLSDEKIGRWEIAEQWRLAWRGLKWFVVGGIILLAFLAAGQVYLFYQLFADIHPILGWSFVAVVTGIFVWFVGMPLLRFFRLPKIGTPPDIDFQSDNIDLAHLKERFAFDQAYLDAMASNPALTAKHGAILAASKDLRNLAHDKTLDAAQGLQTFERTRIAPLLSELDKEIDEYIQKEALAVGAATTVSMNGSIDAFFVLWRNVNMVARIARLYYGRPSLRLSLLIFRDVAAAVILSRALDAVTEAAGEALGSVISRLGGIVIGQLMDGSINALVTLKIGYLAKRRCRSFDVWSEAAAMRATRDVFERVKKESSGLTGELVKLTEGVVSATTKSASAAMDAAGKVMSAPKHAWGMVQDVFVRKPESPNETEPRNKNK